MKISREEAIEQLRTKVSDDEAWREKRKLRTIEEDIPKVLVDFFGPKCDNWENLQVIKWKNSTKYTCTFDYDGLHFKFQMRYRRYEYCHERNEKLWVKSKFWVRIKTGKELLALVDKGQV